jgi:hypothetical protein
VLLFLALSVSFDKVALAGPLAGAMFLAVGFLFAVLVTEGMLAALHIRLAVMYRRPYYLLLAVLFAYPVMLSVASVRDYNYLLAWGVYLFPVIGAVAMLTLLPAAHFGHRDARPNGTPWKWPLYPWTLFVFLWIALALRSYSLSFAFEARAGLHPEFHPHFLSPLVLAAAVLLLEIGMAAGNRWAQRVAMLLPLTIVPLALAGVGEIHVDAHFVPHLCSTLGSPLQLAGWALVLFYAIAWLREVRRAEGGVVAALALCGFASRDSFNLDTLAPPQMIPLWMIALLLVSAGLVQEKKWKSIAGGLLAVMLLSYRHEDVAAEFLLLHNGFYVWHAAILLGLLLGLLSNERWARVVKDMAFIAVPLAAWIAGVTYGIFFPDVPPPLGLLYILGLSSLAWGFWHERQQAIDLAAALATTFAVGAAPLKKV